MAVSSVPVLQRPTIFVADVIATADADTDVVIAHGLSDVPDDVSITPLLQVPAALSLWAVTAIDATNIQVTKSVAVGSGNAGAQLRVKAAVPHSIV